MKYKLILAAVALILLVVLLPAYLSQQSGTSPALNDDAVKRLAQNYVETTLPNVTVTGASITSKPASDNNSTVWKVTINYEQRNGRMCKVGKCYWEGPASMFCRIESSQSLGQCQ